MSQDVTENIKLLLQVFGGACFMGLIIGIISTLTDKPPTAKCYCVYYKDGKCLRLQDFYVGEALFCWHAEPKEKDVKNDRK